MNSDLEIGQDVAFQAELEFVPFFNLALQQNAVPVAYELKLKNNTGHDIDKIETGYPLDTTSHKV